MAAARIFALSLVWLATAPAHADDPMPVELRTLAYEMTSGGGYAPSFADPAFSKTDEDGELVDLFDFGSTAPAFATGRGGNLALELSETRNGTTRALNFGRLTLGTALSERRRSTFEYGPNGFEDSAAIEEDATAFVNWDILNDRTKRFGFDVSATQRTFAATAFSPEETSTEVGASFSADVRLSQSLTFTGRAGVNLSDETARFDATTNSASIGKLSISETDNGSKDAYVQGGFSFAFGRNFAFDATLGYARDLDTAKDSVIGRVGAGYKLRF